MVGKRTADSSARYSTDGKQIGVEQVDQATEPTRDGQPFLCIHFCLCWLTAKRGQETEGGKESADLCLIVLCACQGQTLLQIRLCLYVCPQQATDFP